MATANCHRRTSKWFDTVALRLIDIAVLNTRAIYKTLGKEYTMVNLKRLLAYGLAIMSVRDDCIENIPMFQQFDDINIKVKGPESRLDNELHYCGTNPTRIRCAVHVKRCETK